MGKFPGSPQPAPATTANLPAVVAASRAAVSVVLAPEAAWEKSVFPFTIGEEGGLSKDRKDPGNWTEGKVGKGTFVGTKYGISIAAHPGVDIVHLTLPQARAIYWRDYMVSPGFDKLALPLMLVAFDGGVNAGTRHAELWVAQALKEHGIAAQVAKFCALNLAYHKSLKTWGRYGKVWGARIARCQKQALLLAAAAPVAVAPPHAAVTEAMTPKAPQAKHQASAGRWTLFLRSIFSGLFDPLPAHQGA